MFFSLLLSALAYAQEPASPFEEAGPSLGWLFVKTVIAMIVVVVLAFVCLRYLLPRLQVGKQNTRSHIKIIERLGLEPRKALYIIKVGAKAAVIGTSDHAVTKLVDLDPPDLPKEENS